MSRINKDEYYLGIAKAVSLRSTCLRRQYGAVIVKNDEIISTGYNGSPRGEENCCDKGICWKQDNNLPHNSSYAECNSVHAEMNAIISAARKDIIGGILYLYGENSDGTRIDDVSPCVICDKLIKNAGITNIISGSLPKNNNGSISITDFIDPLIKLCESEETIKGIKHTLYNGWIDIMQRQWLSDITIASSEIKTLLIYARSLAELYCLKYTNLTIHQMVDMGIFVSSINLSQEFRDPICVVVNTEKDIDEGLYVFLDEAAITFYRTEYNLLINTFIDAPNMYNTEYLENYFMKSYLGK